jgi:hypothetical protein
LANGWAFAVAARADHVRVASNELAGGGERPTCLVQVRGDVVAEGNQCEHDGEEPMAMLLQASAITASSNRVRGRNAMLILRVNEHRFAAVGNLAPGGTRLNGPTGSLPAPWQALNPMVS